MKSIVGRRRDCSGTATRGRIASIAGRRGQVKTALTLLLVSLEVLPGNAWVFPEHRDITVLAVQRLDAERQAKLQALWAEARSGHDARLCEQMADAAQGASPACIDFAAWAAISGDHSCSAREMLDTVLNAPWAVGVVRVAGRLKAKLAAAKRPSERSNAVRNSDLALQRTDPDYVTRASSNNAHFLLARSDVDIAAEAYGLMALSPKAEVNAMGTYVWYHLRALERAHSIGRGVVPADARADAVRAALADEAFALHFLEDSFASGHVAGNWGGSAMRKGTHDYYSERGLALTTWKGDHFVGQGDAYMKPADAARAANAVRDSLAQLVDSFDGKVELSGADEAKYTEANSFNVCKAAQFPMGTGTRKDVEALIPILEQTPVPGLASGPGELPRFRTEMGTFFGITTGFRGGLMTHGFASGEDGVSAFPGIELAARAGLGLEGVLNQSSDGLVFVEGGVRDDAHASGAVSVPGRAAITGRLRMPFWLIPGDVALAAPVLAFTSRRTLQKMAVGAVNGGLIPWEAGIETRAGRVQMVLGREVGVSIFRGGGDHPFKLPAPGVASANAPLVALDSLQVEFPLLEFRPFRTFSVNQSSGLVFQPYVGFDTPTDISVISPANTKAPDGHTVVTTGLRVVFDWRHYFK